MGTDVSQTGLHWIDYLWVPTCLKLDFIGLSTSWYLYVLNWIEIKPGSGVEVVGGSVAGGSVAYGEVVP